MKESLSPTLRTPGGIVWIAGAGILFGVVAYCHRRAAAYMERDVGRWNLMRNWSFLNPSRYVPEGRRFVYIQIICCVILPVWWLGGGSLLLSNTP